MEAIVPLLYIWFVQTLCLPLVPSQNCANVCNVSSLNTFGQCLTCKVLGPGTQRKELRHIINSSYGHFGPSRVQAFYILCKILCSFNLQLMRCRETDVHCGSTFLSLMYILSSPESGFWNCGLFRTAINKLNKLNDVSICPSIPVLLPVSN